MKDIDKAGFKAGDKVDLYNYDDGIERVAPLFLIVSYAIPEKNTVTYFPETNVLVSVNNVVKESNMPASKYVKINPNGEPLFCLAKTQLPISLHLLKQ